MNENILNNTTQYACVCYLIFGLILGKISHCIYKLKRKNKNI
jgi:hypothetical protein